METIVVIRIKQLIEAEKETPNSFANKIGVVAGSVYNLLKGGQPRISTIDKIVAAYPQYTKEWLLGGEGKVVDAPQDFQINKLQEELKAANKEIERLWALVHHFTGGSKTNFLTALTNQASAVVIPLNGKTARVGAQG